MTTSTSTASIAAVNGIELGYGTSARASRCSSSTAGFGSVEMFGPNIELLAAGRQVIGVDLQSHGRSPAADRPMRFETMADDIAALIRHLGFERAAIMGFSLGGGVALAHGHPAPGRSSSASSSCRPRSSARAGTRRCSPGMDAMGPEIAEPCSRARMYEALLAASRRESRTGRCWCDRSTDVVKVDYDWSAEIPRSVDAGHARGR